MTSVQVRNLYALSGADQIHATLFDKVTFSCSLQTLDSSPVGIVLINTVQGYLIFCQAHCYYVLPVYLQLFPLWNIPSLTKSTKHVQPTLHCYATGNSTKTLCIDCSESYHTAGFSCFAKSKLTWQLCEHFISAICPRNSWTTTEL